MQSFVWGVDGGYWYLDTLFPALCPLTTWPSGPGLCIVWGRCLVRLHTLQPASQPLIPSTNSYRITSRGRICARCRGNKFTQQSQFSSHLPKFSLLVSLSISFGIFLWHLLWLKEFLSCSFSIIVLGVLLLLFLSVFFKVSVRMII